MKKIEKRRVQKTLMLNEKEVLCIKNSHNETIFCSISLFSFSRNKSNRIYVIE